jgi:hypothetical protein
LLSAAIAAVRDCADTMETQATGLTQALPELSLDGESQAAVLELASGLKDTAGRVTFELALLQAKLGEGEMPDRAAVQRLSNLDATMMTALDAVADVAGQLEKAAELQEQCEPPFALVMQAARVMLRKFGNARAATQVLTDEIAAESTQLRAPEREQTPPDVRVAADGSVVILRAGAEGGDVTLIGRTTDAGTWAFARVTDDQTEALFGESGVQIEAPPAPKPDDWVESWDDGLRLMDRYKWARLHPLYVHPAFVERVRVAVEARLAKEPQDRWTEYAREKWEGLFSRGGQGL